MESVINVMKELAADPYKSTEILNNLYRGDNSTSFVKNPNIGSSSTSQRKKRQRTNTFTKKQ